MKYYEKNYLWNVVAYEELVKSPTGQEFYNGATEVFIYAKDEVSAINKAKFIIKKSNYIVRYIRELELEEGQKRIVEAQENLIKKMHG